MTPDTLQPLHLALDEVITHHLAAALPHIQARVADAAVHADRNVAERRLAELAGVLVPVIRDAREQAYLVGAQHWHGLIPAEYLSRPTPEPAPGAVLPVREALVHGHELGDVLGHAVGEVARSLRIARNSRVPSALDLWQTRATETLSRTFRTLLTDGAEYAQTQAGRDLIHPDWIDDTPISDE